MSVEPQALERSVLERKERDELAAIAEAMGVKTGSRTSKANLIGQILREAGIDEGEGRGQRRGERGCRRLVGACGERRGACCRGDQERGRELRARVDRSR